MEDVTPSEYATIDTLKKLQRLCHAENLRWWRDPATGEPINPYEKHLVGEKLMLVVSEVAEAMEGHRKDTMDAHLPEFKSITVELADALIRIFDLADALQLNLPYAFVAKLRYNTTRPDHTHTARLAPGGKAY
jgi:NTP pyrophosphatase (non-canonical NTP hydrolase)